MNILLKRVTELKDTFGNVEAQIAILRMNSDLLTPEENEILAEFEKKIEAIRLRAVEYYNKVLHL